MIVALEEKPPDTVWGHQPPGWEPINVDVFSPEEWKRAVKQFELHWRPRIGGTKQNQFAHLVKATEEAQTRTAEWLGILRSGVEILCRS